MFLTSAEFFLELTMFGYSEEDKLIQEYVEVVKSTKKFLEESTACHEILNIINLKFASYKKGSSTTLKLLFCILHNLMTFEWVFTVLAHSFSFTNPNNSTGKPHSSWEGVLS
jgi:F0F1-type ATP synthase gamma subunit